MGKYHFLYKVLPYTNPSYSLHRHLLRHRCNLASHSRKLLHSRLVHLQPRPLLQLLLQPMGRNRRRLLRRRQHHSRSHPLPWRR